MRVDFTGIAGTDWRLEAGSHTFSGPPDDCTGTLTIRNVSSARVRIRRLRTSLPARVRQGFSALAPSDIRLRLNLPPGSSATAQARLELPASTPPGRYLAHLGAGDDKTTLDVHVASTRLLELDPEDQILVGSAGDPVSFTVTLRNAGNVPIELQRMTPVWLTEQDWQERLLATTLREGGDSDDFAAFAQRLLERARQDIPAPGQLTTEPSLPLPLAIGQSIDLKLSLALPDNLRAGHGYTGFIRFNEERLDLEVYCEGPATAAPASERASESHSP